MQRRNFIRLVGGGSLTATTAGLVTGCMNSAYPTQALEAWNGPAATVTDPRRRALAYAITAPNPHNLQPWLIDLRETNVITLYTDPQRVLPETDPFGRQILIGHGAFLELLVIALLELGLSTHMTLWPQGELPATLKDWPTNQRPVARITLLPGGRKDSLFAQILNRHTPKTLYDTSRPVSQDELHRLLSVLDVELQQQIRLQGTVDTTQVATLRELCRASSQIEINTPRTMMESIRLVRVGPDEILKHRDGISINSPFVRGLTVLGMFDRSQAPAPGSTGHNNTIERFEGHSKTAMGFVWLSSGNTRADQINAGRAYVRLQLQATSQGIAMHPMSQPLQEFAEMKPYYERVHQLLLNKSAPSRAQDDTVQMFCRIGYCEAVSGTPRRSLDSFIKNT